MLTNLGFLAAATLLPVATLSLLSGAIVAGMILPAPLLVGVGFLTLVCVFSAQNTN